MTSYAVKVPQNRSTDNFGNLDQLDSLTSEFITACSNCTKEASNKFSGMKLYIQRNSTLDENGSINAIFHAIVKASKNNPAIPNYEIGALTHAFASGYSESDPVLQTLASIGQQAKQPASHLKIVKS